MSVPHPLLRVEPTLIRSAIERCSWAALGAFLGLAAVIAAQVDFKMGVAFVAAIVVSAIVIARPVLVLHVAIVSVFFENSTFGGTTVTRLIAPFALFVIAVELFRGTARVRFGGPLGWTVAYVGWAMASGIWTASSDGTRFLLQSLAIALVFLVAYAALVNTERELRDLLYTLTFVSALTAALSVFAFAWQLDIPYLELLQAGRSQGGVGDPDFFAAMQLVVVPLVLVLASETSNRRARVVLYLGLLCILTSIFTSLSRGGFIGIVVLGFLFVVSRADRMFRSRQEKAFALFVVALGLVLLFSRPYFRDQVVTRASSIYAPKSKEDTTGSGRTNIWKAAARTTGEHPVLGVGFGSFSFVSQELILNTPGVDPEVLQLREDGKNFVAHNTYLGTSAELGLIGLFLYLGVLVSTALALRRATARAMSLGSPFTGRIAHALLLGLAAWAVATVFLSGETARMLWIIVGLSLALPKLMQLTQSDPDA
jgi:O-antigen ligase